MTTLTVIFSLLWVASSAISVYFILRWKKGEGWPWDHAKPRTYQEADSLEGQGKDNAWSSDMQDADNPFHGEHESDDHPLRPDGREEDEDVLLHSTETDEGRHPGTPWGSSSPPPPSYMPNEQDYRNSSRYGDYSAPSALSPGEYESHGAYDNYRTGNHNYSSPDYR